MGVNQKDALTSTPALISRSSETILQGRDEVIAETVQNCHAERLTVIASEPGLGVTSLLYAGIAPVLQREGYIVVTFSAWQGRYFATNLKEAIAEAVRQAADPKFFAETEPLDDLLLRARTRTGRLFAILLDQFEDYVRCHSNTVASDFFDAELAHAIADHKGVFVIGLQEHAVPAFERLKAHIPNLLGFRIQLAPLSAEAARAAVVSQLAAESPGTKMTIEPAALDALITAPLVARDDSRAHPFFLHLAVSLLLETEKQSQSPVLRASTIEQRGGADAMILESLDGPIGDLDKAQIDLLFQWCGMLISPNGQRHAVTEKGLTDRAGRSRRLVPALLAQLTEMGILRSVETPEAVRYEIARDCFAPILRDWWERRETGIVARRRAIFRITSISGALLAILAIYVIWMLVGQK